MVAKKKDTSVDSLWKEFLYPVPQQVILGAGIRKGDVPGVWYIKNGDRILHKTDTREKARTWLQQKKRMLLAEAA